jgi:putative heme-binding domain-containing protein
MFRPIISLGLLTLWCDPVFGEEPPRSQTLAADRASEPSSPAAWYGEGVRPTEARTPEQERQGFHLPAGFVIELVAAEPQISKPLNMAFDARGRLWVTDTLEYPYQVAPGQPARDTLRILEDSDGDGQFDRSTTFADNLNIPIGILPYGDGAICFSIPNIWYLRDTDGDGKCDVREKLIGPFDTSRDTHGMVNALRRGDDGWIYACHGFNNQSTVAGKDGHKITLVSGNTFRFRPDGSRVEIVSLGQVNPYGMDSDERGQYYTADCHSKPITQVIPGACYPSFGRPHDGLGFAHSMMDHLHGSTAICGLVFYQGKQLPEIFQDSFISGNVMTSRLNRNTRRRVGTTEYALEQGDFMTSDDTWFRPVDIRLGPDGALYVADFYNKIIGHYEVPLPHPGRDRFRGRIWRIRYAPNGETPSPVALTLNTQNPKELVAHLSSENATLRRLALDQLTDRCGQAASNDLLASVNSESVHARYLAMWGLARMDALTDQSISKLAQDASPLVRLHVAKVIGTMSLNTMSLNTMSLGTLPSGTLPSGTLPSGTLPLGNMPNKSTDFLLSFLNDPDADVVRTAAESLGKGNSSAACIPLLQKLHQANQQASDETKDTVLIQTLRIALRNLFLNDETRQLLIQAWNNDAELPAEFQSLKLSERFSPLIFSILHGVAHPDSALLLQKGLVYGLSTKSGELETLQHIAKWSPPENLASLIDWIAKTYAETPQRQLQMLQNIESGLSARGLDRPAAVRQWSKNLAVGLLNPWLNDLSSSTPAISWGVDTGEVWNNENRHCDDGVDYTDFRSSLTRGEAYVGTLRTSVFTAPEKLSFWLVGHNGFPDQTDKKTNRCELVAADSGEVLKTEFPPRSDIGRQISWDLSSWNGRPVFVRCIDGDNATAYAWIAVGRFSLSSLNPDGAIHDVRDALRIISRYSLEELKPEIQKIASSPKLDEKSQLDALAVLAQIDRLPLLQSFAEFAAQDLNLAKTWNQSLRKSISLDSEAHQQWLKTELPLLIKPLTSRQQTSLVKTLAARSPNADWIADSFEAGLLSNAVLRDQTLRELLKGLFRNTKNANRWAKINDSLPSEDEATLKRWNQLVSATPPENRDNSKGKSIFVEKCSQCHQIGGQGKLVGPQLDGVGKRTQERLLEDILLPNRNVDHAFRTSTLLLDDGSILVGLVRNETDEALSLIDGEGKEQTIPIADITERKQNSQSVMPGNFHEVLDDSAILNLLNFLKSQP